VATQSERLRAQRGRSRADGALGAPRTPEVPTRADQRSRLLAAIVQIVAQNGYPDAKVADLVGCAGVSRATFYQLFENKQACLLAAQAELAERIGLVGLP